MILFEYLPDITAQYPDVSGGVLYAHRLHNGPSPDALVELYIAEQEKVRTRLPASLSEVPTLTAWRAAFRRFGANPTKYRTAAEALLRRLQKKGDIPSINCLVDIGNLVSIRYALPVAIMDCRDVAGTVSVHLAQGEEQFRELDKDEIVHPPAGEVIFSDETGMVLARRWCWRQSLESASRPDTSTALVTVESQLQDGSDRIEQAVADLAYLLRTYAGGQVQSALVNALNPRFEVKLE